ncbi:YbaN family protein [Vallitalea pronyensis]|uniref:YbaN family protein n=1 Tax=Vallitalea pronyensis TaxID=1348613 RepID=A0A8J8MIU0_9FIRM|nr:YbaN family protein [Vallitalea pronyensis]QUI22445.1 YbaN family protein [Vallitalea pronyensis]
MIKKVILIMAGFIALALGIIGIMLPLLPTTPLLLLAAGCFIKSSKRLYTWLVHHKTLGPYVYNYLELRAISKNTKIIAISSMWLSLIITMIVINKAFMCYMLFFVGVGASIYILSLNNVEKVNCKERE